MPVSRTNLLTLVVLLVVALLARYFAVVVFDLASIGAANSAIRDVSSNSEVVSSAEFREAAGRAVYDAVEQNTGRRHVVHLVLDAMIIVSMLWWSVSRRGNSKQLP